MDEYTTDSQRGEAPMTVFSSQHDFARRYVQAGLGLGWRGRMQVQSEHGANVDVRHCRIGRISLNWWNGF